MIRLSVPALLLYRDPVLRVIQAACKLSRVKHQRSEFEQSETELADQVVSAVGEAFNNIVLHGYRDMEPGTVELAISIEIDRLVIDVADWGRTFDPSNAPNPDFASLPENHMGLFIMRSFMNEVSYRPGRPPASPNSLRLIKRF